MASSSEEFKELEGSKNIIPHPLKGYLGGWVSTLQFGHPTYNWSDIHAGILERD
jgi:hypothetical protein